MTWDLAVLRVVHPSRTFYLRVPRPAAQRLQRLWTKGALDAPLTAFAARPATGAVATLDEPAAGLFDEVEAPATAAARMEPSKASAPAGGKRKRRVLPPPFFVPPPPAVPAPRPRPRWPFLLIGLIVLLTTVTVWTGWPGRPGPSGSPTPSVSEPCAVVGLAAVFDAVPVSIAIGHGRGHADPRLPTRPGARERLPRPEPGIRFAHAVPCRRAVPVPVAGECDAMSGRRGVRHADATTDTHAPPDAHARPHRAVDHEAVVGSSHDRRAAARRSANLRSSVGLQPVGDDHGPGRRSFRSEERRAALSTRG